MSEAKRITGPTSQQILPFLRSSCKWHCHPVASKTHVSLKPLSGLNPAANRLLRPMKQAFLRLLEQAFHTQTSGHFPSNPNASNELSKRLTYVTSCYKYRRGCPATHKVTFISIFCMHTPFQNSLCHPVLSMNLASFRFEGIIKNVEFSSLSDTCLCPRDSLSLEGSLLSSPPETSNQGARNPFEYVLLCVFPMKARDHPKRRKIVFHLSQSLRRPGLEA